MPATTPEFHADADMTPTTSLRTDAIDAAGAPLGGHENSRLPDKDRADAMQRGLENFLAAGRRWHSNEPAAQ